MLIDRPCSSHLLYSTLNALWESILCIKLHLSSTIERDGLLVEFPAIAVHSSFSYAYSITSSNSMRLRGLLDTTLSSVNVGQTL